MRRTRARGEMLCEEWESMEWNKWNAHHLPGGFAAGLVRMPQLLLPSGLVQVFPHLVIEVIYTAACPCPHVVHSGELR
jgi:hypothetical protein